jgi:hypothetical protein
MTFSEAQVWLVLISGIIVALTTATTSVIAAMKATKASSHIAAVKHDQNVIVNELASTKGEVTTLKVEVNHRLTQLLAITAQAAHAEGVMQANKAADNAVLVLAAKAAGEASPVFITTLPLTPVVQEMVTQAEESRLRVDKVEEAQAQQAVAKAQSSEPTKKV